MPIIVNQTTVVLESRWLRRVIETGGGIVSKTYHTKPGGNRQDVWYPVFSFEEGVPFEAALTADGVYYEASAHKRDASNDEKCRRGAFNVTDIITGKSKIGDTVEFVMNRRWDDMPDIELHIVYELCDDTPFLKKSVRVLNRGECDVEVDNVTVDILRYFDGKISLTTFTDYYWDTKIDDKYDMGWVRSEFPEDIGVVLSKGESFESFSLYEAVTGVDRQDDSYQLHRIIKRVAPWVKTLKPAICTNSCRSMDELFAFADMMKENGIEIAHLHVGQIFSNTGDYIPRKDIFPGGYEDLKKLTAYFHSLGLQAMTYCSTTIANHSSEVCRNHPDWQYLGPQGKRYSPEGFGNMCYQSPWGDYIREKLLFLLDEIGFDGLALDGPYHGLPCLEKNHRHKTAKAVKYMNWAWEKKFFAEVVARGKLINVPQVWNSLLIGANKTPAGYREEDQNEFGGMPLVTMTRSCVYESRYDTPSCCHWTSFNIEPYHGHSSEADENDTTTYEHSIAGMFGYGFDCTIYGKMPYIGENTKKIFFKWINIFKKYRDTFLGEFIHIAQPNGYTPDAVMHAAPEAEVPGLVVIFNPTKETAPFYAVLPLRYAGFEGNTSALIDGVRVPLDYSANAMLNVTLAPGEVKVVEVRR